MAIYLYKCWTLAGNAYTCILDLSTVFLDGQKYDNFGPFWMGNSLLSEDGQLPILALCSVLIMKRMRIAPKSNMGRAHSACMIWYGWKIWYNVIQVMRMRRMHQLGRFWMFLLTKSVLLALMIVFIVKLQQTADENLFCVHKYGNELCNNETLVVYFFLQCPSWRCSLSLLKRCWIS